MPVEQCAASKSALNASNGNGAWVDLFNTFGLGRNVPINTGNESEGLLLLKDGKGTTR
jgi:hypothetical protein